ncbi:hypothetical protein DSM3645_06164 [Blastopirellula marina DSM 3645]|uniref:DUF1559 domain-containing protein n=2 Tax=Blastopirellula marina TaxID=124 RepID=A4A077_9BACT|nr:hypothetical protein DSM3645_06164 [Blastopirellula marina DSM 3645]
MLIPSLGHPTYLYQHAAARRQTRQVVMALSVYQAIHQASPPRCIYGANGRPMHSWRALLIPILENEIDPQLSEYRFDEPWDSPHNRKLHGCKSPFHFDNDPGAPTHTSVVAIVTDQGDSMQLGFFDDDSASEKPAPTYLMTGKNLGIHWLAPEDVDFVDPQLFREGDRKQPLRKGNFTIQSNGDVEDTGEPIQ